MSEKIEVRVSHQFSASAEQVYDAWLDPAKARIWQKAALQRMGLAGDIVTVDIDARVGGKFLFSDMRDGVETKHRGSYLELDRPRKIVFTWIVDPSEESDPSVVTLTIEPNEDGCTATIVHEMDASWSDYIEQTENGWSCLLTEAAKL